MKYQIGDKVKILWGKTFYCSNYYADKGEIVSANGGEYVVRGFSTIDYTLTFKEDELILLEEEKQTTKRHLKRTYNDVKDITLEQFINEEYELYCLTDDKDLSQDAIKIKYAWLLIIERLKRNHLLMEVKQWNY